MPSPDVNSYIQLSLVDQDPQDIYQKAIAELKANFPEWEPREGNMEVLLLEAMALQVAESVFAINRLPSAITEVLLTMFGIERDSGAPPTADVRFEMAGTQGFSIPAGVSVRLSGISEFGDITFTTDSELIIPPGQNFGVISATAAAFTDEANDVPSETLLELSESLIYVNYVRLDSDVSGGRSPESELDFLTRGINRFQRLSTTLVLPSHFVAAAMEDSRIERAFALDNYNPDLDLDKNGPVGQDGGHISLALYGNNEFLSDEDKADFYSSISPGVMASLQVHLIDPIITAVDVSAAVAFQANSDPAEVVQDIIFALQEYLNPATWEWGSVVRRTSLISLINNVVGVDYLVNLTTPAIDVTLPGVANLVTAGTLTIAGP